MFWVFFLQGSNDTNDSGRGTSDHEVQNQFGDGKTQFDFNMPSELCGRFIGKQGKNINHLKLKTGANVSLTYNPFTPEFQICQVAGELLVETYPWLTIRNVSTDL